MSNADRPRPPEDSVPEENRNKAEEMTDHEFIGLGDFEEMKKMMAQNLRLRSLVYNEINAIKRRYEDKYGLAEVLDECDYEVLACLRLFHKESFKHSLETLDELRRVIKKIVLWDGRRLLDVILEELDNDLKPLEKGAIMHDVGKLEIPAYVTENTLKASDWKARFLAMGFEEQRESLRHYALWQDEKVPPEAFADQQQLLDFIHRKKIKFNHLVPIRHGLTEKQSDDLARRGFYPDRSLIENISSHAQKGGDIIANLNPGDSTYALAARFARNHHEGDQELNRRYPAATTSLFMTHRLALMDQVVSLIDIKTGISSRERSYRDGPLEFSSLYNEVQRKIEAKKINPYVAALVLEFWLEESRRKAAADAEKTDGLKEGERSKPTAEEMIMIYSWIKQQKDLAEFKG